MAAERGEWGTFIGGGSIEMVAEQCGMQVPTNLLQSLSFRL